MLHPPVLRILWLDPDVLTPSPHAAKAHTAAQVQALAAGIKASGLDQPLVTDSDGVLIKGHARRQAALLLGLGQVPVIVRHDLDENEKRQARLADNSCAESHWLPDILASELETLAEQRPDLLQASGFTHQQIQGLVQRETPPPVACKAYEPDGGLRRQCPNCGERFAR